MADTARNQEFEEPDGFPAPEADDDGINIEIEVLDDVPAEDQGVPRPAADRIDPDSDEFEAEIKDYSDAAQQRIKALKFEFHEERRAKETALRQSDEAVKYAETVSHDNAQLKQGLSNTNEVLIEQYGARSDAELETARTAFKEAYEGGDTDALLLAQEGLSKLHAERAKGLADAEAFQRRQPQQQQQQQQTQQQQPILTPDARAMEWIRKNPWYQAAGNEDMTGYATGLHQKLVAKGLHPQLHEEYYTEIDQGLRTVFPEKFSAENLGGNGAGNPVSAETGGKKPPPVGGPSRGGKPPRKVQLTASAVALAKRLGLTNKQYAAQVAKEQMADG